MANLLYLVHRLPYPPNKGDKVRSFHVLQHLLARHNVHVGTFVDDAEDEVHVDTLRKLCTTLHVERLHPTVARVASLAGLFSGTALTLHYYRNAGLQKWVNTMVLSGGIDASIIFSSSMAQYLESHTNVPILADLVDVDSVKWADYAPNHRWPMSWLYKREGRCLLDCERAVASQARRTFFATEVEAQLFRGLAPESASRVEAMNNGVDANFFSVDPGRVSPFPAEEVALVFTGAMDYWPNIDAVIWFAQQVLPGLLARWPRIRFHIVGRSPTATVRALACDNVTVTGTVPDVRPYLQHANVVVAPLRLARGIQNKILEAMSMARPVVATRTCVAPLEAEIGVEILAASEAEEFALAIDLLLQSPDRATEIGNAGRQRVLMSYSWAAHLAVLDRGLVPLIREVETAGHQPACSVGPSVPASKVPL